MRARIQHRGNRTILRLEPGPPDRPTQPPSTARANAVHARYRALGLCRMGCGRPLQHFTHRCDVCQARENRRTRRAYAKRRTP